MKAVAVLHHLRGLAAAGGPVVSDAELLQRFCRERDPAAFEAILRRYGRLVFGVCRHVLGHVQDAEDAFQATFLTLARRPQAVHKPAALAAWLHGVAYHTATRARRDSARRRARERRVCPGPPVPGPGEPGLYEIQALLDAEVQRLPEPYRTVFVLCVLECRGTADVAEQLGCKPGTVSGRLSRARQMLLRRLAWHGVTLSAALTAAALARHAEAATVPAALSAATVSFGAAGRGIIPERVMKLAGGIGRGVALARIGTLLALALSVAGLGITFVASADPPPADEPVAVANAMPHVAVDAYGDPLPEGAVARLGTVRFRLGWGNSVVAFLPGDKAVLTASTGAERGTSFSVWEAATGKLLRRFGGPPAYPSCVAVSSDGLLAAAVNWTGRTDEDRFTLWDVAKGKRLPRPELLPDETSQVAFSPNNKTLAVASRDKALRLCDPITGAERVRCAGPPADWTSLSFSPDGRQLVAVDTNNEACLWDAATGTQRYSLGRGDAQSTRCVFSPDGKTLAMLSGKTVRLLDRATGKEVRRLESEARLASVAFAPDGKTLATGDDPSFESPVLVRSAVRVWDVASGKQLRAMPAHAFGVYTLNYSGNGQVLASVGQNVLRLWDPATGKDLVPLPEFESWVVSVAFLPDGKTLATGGLDGGIRFWEPGGRNPVRLLEDRHRQRVFQVTFTPDGKTFTSVGLDGKLRQCDAATGREVRSWDAHKGGLTGVACSPDGRTLVSGGRDRAIRLWEAATGKQLWQVDIKPPAFTDSLRFSADGKEVVASVGDPKAGHSVQFWDAATGKEGRSFGPYEGGPLARSHDGKAFALVEGYMPVVGAGGRTVRVWDVATGKERSFQVPTQPRVASAAFSPDGRSLVWGDYEGTVWLAELASGRVRRRFSGHSLPPLELTFSPDGRFLASGSQDTTVLLWDVRAPVSREVPSPEALWADLASEDAAVAWRSVGSLAAATDRYLPLLRDKLRPAASPDASQIVRLIAGLGGERFDDRARAEEELAKFGELAETALRKAAKDDPSAEVRRRAAGLLERIDAHASRPEGLRQMRALEALESSGPPAARRLLRELAGGASETWLTREARASLQRLERRPAVP